MRSRRLSIIAISLSAHVALVLGLFVAGFWHLDRLDAEKRTVAITVPHEPPPAPSGGGGAAPLPPMHRKLPPPRIPVPVPHPETPAVAADPTPPGELPGNGPGSGKGPATADPPGHCDEPPCGDDPDSRGRKPAPEVKKQTETVVPPAVIRALRISGETQLQPPDPVKIRMARDGQTTASPSLEVCLSDTGEVTRVSIRHSSGYDAYDRVLLDGVRAWRYRPYRVGAIAVPVCGIVIFKYAIE